jgi:hypothetical protein
MLALALPATAATPSEFYLAMLRKGIVAHDAGRFDAATGPLRVAAFGLVDSIEHYQTAHIYLALSFDRLGNAEQARDSARRVVAAERIAARYGSLTLPTETRANFQALARRALTEGDLAILGRSARAVTAQAPPPQQTTTPVQPPAVRPQTTPPVTPLPAQTSQATQTNGATTAPAVTTTTVVEKPAPAPVTTTTQVKPAPAKPEASTTTTTTTAPPKPQPQPIAKPPVNVAARITAAEQALTQARLSDARAIYRELLDANNLQRADILRVAEGFYRSRDFAHALRAFEKLGPLRREEQPYRYYIAVALYETAQYTKAKEELAAVLPFIEETPDVSRYRVKIENAIN